MILVLRYSHDIMHALYPRRCRPDGARDTDNGVFSGQSLETDFLRGIIRPFPKLWSYSVETVDEVGK